MAEENILLLLTDYPVNMQPKHVADFLGVSVSTVYNMINSGSMPTLIVPGSRLKIIPKLAFAEWYGKSVANMSHDNQENNANNALDNGTI